MVEGSGVQSEEDWGIGCVGEILEKGMKSDFGRRHEAQSDCRNQWMYCIISHGSIFIPGIGVLYSFPQVLSSSYL
jgi:hypothetical protein